MISYTSKSARNVLRIILDRLKINVTPNALSILTVIYDTFPRSFFESVIKQLDRRIRVRKLIVIDGNDVRDVVRMIISSQIQPSRTKAKVKAPTVDIRDLLLKQKSRKLGGHGEAEKQIMPTEPSAVTSKPVKQSMLVSHQEAEKEIGAKKEVEKRIAEEIPAVGKSESKQKTAGRRLEASSTVLEKPTKEEFVKKTRASTITREIPVEEPTAKAIPVVKEKTKPTAVERLESLKASIVAIKTIPWYLLSDSPETFKMYFLSRYEKLRAILEKRITGGLLSGADLRPGEYGDSYIIIMVDSKELAKNHRGGIIIGDDPYSRFRVYIPFDVDPDLRRKFDRVMLDTVIALKVRAVRSEKFVIATDIIFPDLPRIRTRNRANKPTKIVVAGDIHLGSKQFMREKFERFIKFLRGETKNNKLNELAEEIEYIIFIGDLVDGVGVYPQQKDELAIFNQKKQYELLAEYLSKIPDDKLIIAIPGNHDASTRLVPQPPISEKLAKPLYELPTIQILSNPSMIDLRGVKILLYHGQGFERLAGILGIKLENIHSVTIETLRWRHLCPQWGLIPQAPTYEDHLVIEEEPDVVVTGHLHICDSGRYRGTAILSVGSFEGLTTWQRDIGISPTVGYFQVLDIQTYNLTTLRATERHIEVLKQIRI